MTVSPVTDRPRRRHSIPPHCVKRAQPMIVVMERAHRQPQRRSRAWSSFASSCVHRPLSKSAIVFALNGPRRAIAGPVDGGGQTLNIASPFDKLLCRVFRAGLPRWRMRVISPENSRTSTAPRRQPALRRPEVPGSHGQRHAAWPIPERRQSSQEARLRAVSRKARRPTVG